MKPRIFIGSSARNLDIAYAIQSVLHHDSEPVVWDQNVFQLGQSNLDALLRQLDRSDFAIFVFAPDDITTMQKKRSPTVRDNVIFEFGLFMGKLDRERVYALHPRGSEIHLPSDLGGVIFGEYDPDQELVSSIGPFCFQVKLALKRFTEGSPGSRATVQARSTEQVLEDVISDIRTLVQKQLSTQYIGIFPNFLRAHVCPCIREARSEVRIATNSSSIGYFSDYESYREYRTLLEQKKESDVPVKVILMAEERQHREVRRQFADTTEEWRFLTEDPQNLEFQRRLGEFTDRTLAEVRQPSDFYAALHRAEANARRSLKQRLTPPGRHGGGSPHAAESVDRGREGGGVLHPRVWSEPHGVRLRDPRAQPGHRAAGRLAALP